MNDNRLPDRPFKAWKRAAEGERLPDNPFKKYRSFVKHYAMSDEAELSMIERDALEVQILCKRIEYERKNSRA